MVCFESMNLKAKNISKKLTQKYCNLFFSVLYFSQCAQKANANHTYKKRKQVGGKWAV